MGGFRQQKGQNKSQCYARSRGGHRGGHRGQHRGQHRGHRGGAQHRWDWNNTVTLIPRRRFLSPTPQDRQPKAPINSEHCEFCGAVFVRHQSWIGCPTCLRPFSTPEGLCPKCSKPYSDDAMFCRRCGSKVNGRERDEDGDGDSGNNGSKIPTITN